MAAAPTFRQRWIAAIRAAASRAAFPFRRVAAAVERAWERRNPTKRELAWYRRRDHSLSITRPKALPTTAPTGTDAREMPMDGYQNHPGYGITVERVVSIFGNAESGYAREQCDLFDDLIETDCTLRSLFEQRSQAVAGKPSQIQAGGGTEADKQAARVLGFAMSRLPLIPFFQHQLTCTPYGYGVSEIDWGVLSFEGKLWHVPVWIANVPARRFAIDPKTNTLRLLTVANPTKGEELRAGKWVVTTRTGPLARAGLMRSATFPACYKRFGTRDWVIYSNKYGLPLVLVSYDDSGPGALSTATDDPARIVCQSIVANIGSDGGAVLPSSVKVNIEDAGRAGDSGAVHGGLIAYCNAENAKLINGSTLASDNEGSGGASYALGEVHASVRWDNIQFDAQLLEESFRTQLASAFIQFNGLAAAPPLLRMQVVRDLTPLIRAQVTDIFINKLGGKASATQLGEELGYRAPLDDDDELPGATTEAAVAEPAAPLKAVA